MKKNSFWFLTALFCILNFIPTFSFSGWNKIDGEYVYLNEEGRKVLNDWRSSSGEMYFLDENGFIVKNTLMEINGDIYFFDNDGKRINNKFVMVLDMHKKTEDYMENGFYYFDENGKAFKKKDKNFIKKIGGVPYGFNEHGVLYAEAWFDKDGELIYDYPSIITEGVYHTDGKGRVYCNNWYKFSDDLAASYINDENLDHNRLIADQYSDMNDLWIYFDSNCKKVVSNTDSVKKKTIDGEEYAFDAYGIMVKGFTVNDDLVINQYSNPYLGEKISYYGSDGKVVKDAWLNKIPTIYMDEIDNRDGTNRWFYANELGKITYNKIRNIGGKNYCFDGIGRMKTGFTLFDRAGFFVAHYDPDELTSEDFIYSIDEGSRLYGSDNADIRFCGINEEDGAVRYGDVKIELQDGEFTFSFSKNTGIAIGNKNKIKKSDDIYYINGLKLTAKEDMRYGIVKVSDDEYRVVNKNGKIVKGNRKLIKDDYENYIIIINSKFAGYVSASMKDGIGDYIQIKWQKNPDDGGETGYYFYNKSYEVKDYEGIACPSGKLYPENNELNELPDEMKLNFR